MSPREYDESDARVRPSRSTRPRSKDRPSHNDAISALVTTVDRGRQTCITEDGTIVQSLMTSASTGDLLPGSSVQLRVLSSEVLVANV